ncbi:lactose-binding lectin l-2-like [Sphaeramia orbicularis]|nr:lactose-binding lectin l-2-like [Sphaeramia orbicularis]
MQLFIFLSILALVVASPPRNSEVNLQQGDCSGSWFSFNNRCYKYVASQMTWADAELHCVSQTANLVSIHSQEENAFVRTLIKSFDPAQGRAWVGLTDAHKEGSWMWSDGSSADFSVWHRGEPSNNGGKEHCVHLNFGQDKSWNDVPCSQSYASVCISRVNCPSVSGV